MKKRFKKLKAFWRRKSKTSPANKLEERVSRVRRPNGNRIGHRPRSCERGSTVDVSALDKAMVHVVSVEKNTDAMHDIHGCAIEANDGSNVEFLKYAMDQGGVHGFFSALTAQRKKKKKAKADQKKSLEPHEKGAPHTDKLRHTRPPPIHHAQAKQAKKKHLDAESIQQKSRRLAAGVAKAEVTRIEAKLAPLVAVEAKIARLGQKLAKTKTWDTQCEKCIRDARDEYMEKVNVEGFDGIKEYETKEVLDEIARNPDKTNVPPELASFAELSKEHAHLLERKAGLKARMKTECATMVKMRKALGGKEKLAQLRAQLKGLNGKIEAIKSAAGRERQRREHPLGKGSRSLHNSPERSCPLRHIEGAFQRLAVDDDFEEMDQEHKKESHGLRTKKHCRSKKREKIRNEGAENPEWWEDCKMDESRSSWWTKPTRLNNIEAKSKKVKGLVRSLHMKTKAKYRMKPQVERPKTLQGKLEKKQYSAKFHYGREEKALLGKRSPHSKREIAARNIKNEKRLRHLKEMRAEKARAKGSGQKKIKATREKFEGDKLEREKRKRKVQKHYDSDSC